MGVYDGMVMKTTLGASTDLRIQNIFEVIQYFTNQTANYSFERLITDFQNLRINKNPSRKTDFDMLMSERSGANKFGVGNRYTQKLEESILDIVGYDNYKNKLGRQNV